MANNDLSHLSIEEKRALLKKMMNEKKDSENKNSNVFKTPETERIEKLLALIASMEIDNPYFHCSDGASRDTINIKGHNYINFSSYNYTGCSGDPYVNKRVSEAIEHYGTSASASRYASGDKTIHAQLESLIAENLGVEAALCFVGGFTANASTVSHLMSNEDLILQDNLVHRSLIDGSVFSGARRLFFNHNDINDLELKCKKHRHQYRNCLIITEGVFSMDGDIADLPQYIEIKNKYNALLMIDEAHSMGVIGRTGKGIREYHNVSGTDVDIWMGTLSKSYATCGGYIAGSQALIKNLKYTCPGFIFSVGLPPPSAAAAIASIELIAKEPQRIATLLARAQLFRDECKRYGLNIGLSKDSGVVPIITGKSAKALYLSDCLLQQGINVQPIFRPAVKKNAARLRFFISCLHSEQQIKDTVRIAAQIMTHMETDPELIQKLQEWELMLEG